MKRQQTDPKLANTIAKNDPADESLDLVEDEAVVPMAPEVSSTEEVEATSGLQASESAKE